jgi:CRP-like cAMP-binding protein
MNSRRAFRPTFATEPTEPQSPTYSHLAPMTAQPDTRDNHCRAPKNNEETAVVTSVFEPKNHFLAALPASDLAMISGLMSFHRLPQGLVLHEPDQRVEHAYFVESGMISLVASMQDGAAIETATLGREAILGALAAFGNHRATARAVVQIEATAWRLPVADLRNLTERSPALRKMSLLSSELMMAQMQQTAACNALHTAERRLCRWIVQVQDRIGDDVIRLTHDFLAQMLAVRRPTVSLIAYQLQQAGLIRYQRGRIAVLDRAALERSACECVGVLREKTLRIVNEAGF